MRNLWLIPFFLCFNIQIESILSFSCYTPYTKKEVSACTKTRSILFSTKDEKSSRDEAEELLQRAKKLRESIASNPTILDDPNVTEKKNDSENVEATDENNLGDLYRLYVDIGREPGTWMDPRWGMSGTRVEFSIDMSFLPDLASADERAKMVKDNFGGKSSQIRKMRCVSEKGARLRRGFDSMACYGGAYRLDYDKKSVVARFFIDVEGLGEVDSSTYGDITIPKGCLYFSIPCFGGSLKNLSIKEGPVTVRQIGWHTGWRREESRIVGIFKVLPLDKAKVKDKF